MRHRVNELTGAKSQLQALPDRVGLDSYSQQRDSWKTKLDDLGFRMIGEGFFGMVFSNPSLPYVLKIFTAQDHAYVTWLKYCLANQNNPHVPKFRGKLVRLGGKVMAVRMEKLRYDLASASDIAVFAYLLQESLETSRRGAERGG